MKIITAKDIQLAMNNLVFFLKEASDAADAMVDLMNVGTRSTRLQAKRCCRPFY